MKGSAQSSPQNSTPKVVSARGSEKFQFVNETGKLNARDVPVIFYQSMMTRVDELSEESHINMSLVEFFEAISRIADKTILRQEVSKSIQVVREHLYSREDKNTNRQITSEQNLRISLAIKIHLIIARMAINCMSSEYRQKFERNRKPLNKEVIGLFSSHLD